MLNEFSKKDLKTGMIVETKEKSRYLVLIGNMKTFVYGSQNIIFISEDGFLTGDEYDDDLKQIKDNSFDIEKVYEGCVKGLDAMIELEDYKLVWERNQEIDWSNVAVDTKVLVRYSDSEQWGKRYFAKYENNIPFVFEDGCTSFTAGKTDNWFSEVRQIVLYEGNESLLENQTKITLNKNVNINNMQCMQSACMEDLADYICELRGGGADRCQGCMFDDFGTGEGCKQSRLNWLKDKTMFI